MFLPIAALLSLFVQASVVDELLQATEKEKISDMLVLGKRAVEEVPESPQAHLWYGVANFWVADMQLADRHLQRAVELAPDSPDVHLYRFYYYFGTGDFERARTSLKTLQNLSPDSDETREALKTSRALEVPYADTPQKQALVKMVEAARKQGPAVLKDVLHPEFLQVIKTAIGTDDLGSASFMKSFLQGVGGDPRWIGYQIGESTRDAPAGSQWLSLQAALFVTLTPEKIENFARLYEHDKQMANPELSWTYERLNAADRKAYLERMKGQRIVSYVDLEVLLALDGADWKVQDILASGTVSLRELVPKIPGAIDKGVIRPDADARAPSNRASRVGAIIGAVAALLLAAAGAMWRRRKRAAAGPDSYQSGPDR